MPVGANVAMWGSWQGLPETGIVFKSNQTWTFFDCYIKANKAEAVEFIVAKPTKFLDVPLKDLKLVKGVLVAAIVRKNEIIIPHGKDSIKQGDNVILITKDKHFSDFNDIIASVEE